MIGLCCEYLFVWCIWLHVIIMSRTVCYYHTRMLLLWPYVVIISYYYHEMILTTQLNHLSSLAKWLNIRVWTKWLWIRIPLLSLKRVIDLAKNQAKLEPYSRRNNIKFSNIPNDIPDNQLENKVMQICWEPGVEVDHNDIEGCHCLPVSRYSRSV